MLMLVTTSTLHNTCMTATLHRQLCPQWFAGNDMNYSFVTVITSMMMLCTFTGVAGIENRFHQIVECVCNKLKVHACTSGGHCEIVNL